MKKNISIALAAIFALGGVVASAQTTPAVSEFHRDIEKGKQDIQGDSQALAVAKEVNDEDSENAGDIHGDSNEVDGENNQDEIDNEIENEVESESTGADQGTTESVETTTSGESGN